MTNAAANGAQTMTNKEFQATIRQMLKDWTDATPEQRAETMRLAAISAGMGR